MQYFLHFTCAFLTPRFAPLRLSPDVLNDQSNIVFDSFGFDIEDFNYSEKEILDTLSRASIIHMDRPEAYGD
jgi:hypothetical protein